MCCIELILLQMVALNKNHRNFMVDYFNALFVCVGRATMTNLSRYGAGSRRRIARWKSKCFDFWQFNLLAITAQGIPKHRCIAVFDCTFLPKSGKKTFGLAKFHNGSASRAEKGLEAGVLALIDMDENTGYALKAVQTPAELDENHTRTDFYTSIVTENAERILQLTPHLVVDGGLAKKKFVTGVRDTGLHLIGKLRHDSKLRYLYHGPRREGRGRPRQFEGRVNYNQLEKLGSLTLPDDGLMLWSGVVNHPEFGINLKVVVVVDASKKGKTRKHVVLYTTDFELSGLDVYNMYKARFQIEFLFRDGKQHTGFGEGQMRDKAGLEFHMNASLSAVNLLRLEDRQHQMDTENRVISIQTWKRRKYNEKLMKDIFVELDGELSEEKMSWLLKKFSSFGTIAA